MLLVIKMLLTCSIVLFGLLNPINAGDDASVHVHVESAPGPDMGMTLPLFNYYRSAMGQPPNPALATAFTKWHGDEFHSQGPDAPSPPQPPTNHQPTNSAEQLPTAHSHRPLEINPKGPYTHDPRSLGPHAPRRATRLQQPSLQERTSREYVIPFPRPSKRNHDAPPRHYHGARYSETVPPWLMRKKFVRKYGLRKYLEPLTQSNFESGLERQDYYEPETAPVEAFHSGDYYRPTHFDYDVMDS